MRKLSYLFLACLIAAFMSGCAMRQPAQVVIERPVQPAEAEVVWNKYLALTKHDNTQAPFKLSSSFRFKTEDSSNRASLLAWGNGNSPARIDVSGPFGSIVASLRVANNDFVLYEPDSNTAVRSSAGEKVCLRLGLPVPVSIKNVITLLRGQYGQLFPRTYQNAYWDDHGNIVFTFVSSNRSGNKNSMLTNGILVLNKQGQPVTWEQQVPSPLTITFEKYDNGLPNKIHVSAGEDRSALFLIKSRSTPAQPFTQQALELKLPPDTRMEELSQADI